MVLAPTHEEAMVELVKSVVVSYRQLPVFLFQFQTKYRNERRPARWTAADPRVRDEGRVLVPPLALGAEQLLSQGRLPPTSASSPHVGVPVMTAEAAVGMMLGDRSFEFLMPTAPETTA